MTTKTAKMEKTEKAGVTERAKKTGKTAKTGTAGKTEKAAKTEGAEKAGKTGKMAKAEKAKRAESGERDLTRDDIIRRYLDIYRRCMAEDPKSFDARGAAHALEQISKLLGSAVSAKDTDENEIVLTLSEEADALGQ